MNEYTVIRNPLNQLPITLVNKAIRQKLRRPLHCLECGKTLCFITDKVILVADIPDDVSRLVPDAIGIVDIQCQQHVCKQQYRLEFAL